jgi:16S rRNA (cytidine1402-2'-O)-methyltransferase
MKKETGVLYIVATPIGNLEDITLRALRTLKEVDVVACEDTRVTKKLLTRFDIKVPTISYHQHSGSLKTKQIIERLLGGKNVALVTDAGTPGISDPGNFLAAEAIENDIKVSPIPGVSAITTLASVSGINMQKFIFLGFPPAKKGRNKFFEEVLNYKYPAVYYESPHRFIKNLERLILLEDALAKREEKQSDPISLIVGRELTKMFEEVVRGSANEVLNYFKDNKDKVKGEFVVIVWRKY